MSWSEESLLRWIARRPRPPGLVGSRGHDAAVLRNPGARLVTCCDQTVEGVHAERGVSPAALARKAVGRTLSDLAATAAVPRNVLLAVQAPRRETETRLRALLRAADAAAREHGAALCGGDLCCGGNALAITVTALGVLPGSRRPPGRDRARSGQLVVLTGPVGGSRLGRHLKPRPRLAEGRFLFEHGATALMDVSDGLARDAARLARASRVRLELEEVPVHRDAHRQARTSGRAAVDHALDDGEDHELLATLAPEAWARIRARVARRFPQLRVVGRVRSGSGLRVVRASGTPPERWNGKGGWVHGT
jgi:thiamine-monophosphate kinase